ncbi:hypothetical protein CAJAP_09608 [Camponotus japonicus]
MNTELNRYRKYIGNYVSLSSVWRMWELYIIAESLCDDLSSLDNFLQQLGQQATMESMESMQSVESVESMESLESMESMEEKSEYFFQS